MKSISICVYGTTNDNVNPFYIEQGEELGKEIAYRGHQLIFGAENAGIMGAVARGAKSENGRILGIIPNFMYSFDNIYQGCTEIITTKTMAEQKETMGKYADAFVITPGGVETMEDFFQILTLEKSHQKQAPIVIFNTDGYYNHLLTTISFGIKEGFIGKEIRDLFVVKNGPVDVLDAIES